MHLPKCINNAGKKRDFCNLNSGTCSEAEAYIHRLCGAWGIVTVLEVLRLEMWLDTKPCQPLQVLVALRASGRHHSKFWWHSEHLADTTPSSGGTPSIWQTLSVFRWQCLYTGNTCHVLVSFHSLWHLIYIVWWQVSRSGDRCHGLVTGVTVWWHFPYSGHRCHGWLVSRSGW